jgi:hypothetical protein
MIDSNRNFLEVEVDKAITYCAVPVFVAVSCHVIIDKIYECNNIMKYDVKFFILLVISTFLISYFVMNILNGIKYIYDDVGIYHKVNASIGPITIFNKNFQTPWEDIVRIDVWAGYITFLKSDGGLLYVVGVVSPLTTNRKQTIEFALSKIPPTCEITNEACIKLKKKYGITLGYD